MFLGAYFVGKMAWQKGLGELYSLMSYVHKRTGKCFPIDIYGQGPHMQEIKDVAKTMKLPVRYCLFLSPSIPYIAS